MLKRFLRNEEGATAIEYGLIAALIFLAVLGAVTAYGDSMTAMYEKIRDNTATATGS